MQGAFCGANSQLRSTRNFTRGISVCGVSSIRTSEWLSIGAIGRLSWPLISPGRPSATPSYVISLILSYGGVRSLRHVQVYWFSSSAEVAKIFRFVDYKVGEPEADFFHVTVTGALSGYFFTQAFLSSRISEAMAREALMRRQATSSEFIADEAQAPTAA